MDCACSVIDKEQRDSRNPLAAGRSPGWLDSAATPILNKYVGLFLSENIWQLCLCP